ncbi:MAG: outer membrane beta-barrel protein [Candidatus Eremiobacteraeota bacterium]|nr:outer membrane beta-barrel protein [Candidatus Eremiobacteraeota bacterium]
MIKMLRLSVAALTFALVPLAAYAQEETPSPLPAASPSPASLTPEAASPAPEPERRALPAPIDPLFIGGNGSDFVGPTIGTPTDRGIRTYGWVDFAYQGSTSHYSNYPLTYNEVPNRFQLDQAIFRVERQPDTVQTDHFDWGFRLSNLYGVDYRWTTQQGILSNQLLLRNQTYGYDPVEAYGMVYFPHWAQGTLVEIGRYISPPDIEAQLAPNNFLYTHSLMFDFDSYTQTGFLFQTKLSNYWTLEYALDWGEDIAPWDGSAHFPTGMLLARWISHSNRDSVLFGQNSMSLGSPNGQSFTTYTKGAYTNPATGQQVAYTWGHDNLQQSNATWTHVFNPGLVNYLEMYYLYQYNAYVGGTINNYNAPTGGPLYLGAGGGPGAFLPGLSSAVGAVDYLEVKVSPRDVVSFRTDYINDPRGERSGFATSYGSLTLGLMHRFNPTLIVRPEIRTEKAFANGVTPYDNGTRGYQSSFAIDLIQNFGNP